MAKRGRTTSAEQRATQAASDHIYENVEAVAAVYEKVEHEVTAHQRGIENLVAALGRPGFLYACLAFVGLWVGFNLLAPRFGLLPFDAPPFFWLQGCVGLTALLMVIIVLIAQ